MHRMYTKENEPLIKALIQAYKLEINLKEGIGNEIFFIACSNGLYSTVQYLLHTFGGTLTGDIGPRVISCFVAAVFNGDMETMDAIRNVLQNTYDDIILEAAVFYDRVDILRKFLNPKTIIKDADLSGLLIWRAVGENNQNSIYELLKYKPINVNFYPKKTKIFPPLLLAAIRGDIKLVKALIDNGADLSNQFWIEVLGDDNVTLVGYLRSSPFAVNRREIIRIVSETQAKQNK